jgi:hypothetical protein
MSHMRDALSEVTFVKRRGILAAIVSLVIFISAGLLTAVATFTILSHYLTFLESAFYPIIGGAFLLAAPILWCVALVVRDSVSRALLKVDAAFFSVDLVADVWQTHIHTGPGLFFVTIGRVTTVILISTNLWMAHISSRRAREKLRRIRDPKFLYLGLTISAIVGLYLGVQAWSPTMPARVVASAETLAQEQPYCIIVDGRPARSADDLTGTRMQAHYQGNYAFNFHSLLVVKAGRDLTFFNWSYRTGRFEPVSEHTKLGLDLDSRAKCKAGAHLARDWIPKTVM